MLGEAEEPGMSHGPYPAQSIMPAGPRESPCPRRRLKSAAADADSSILLRTYLQGQSDAVREAISEAIREAITDHQWQSAART